MVFVSFSFFDKNRIQRRGTFCLFFIFRQKPHSAVRCFLSLFYFSTKNAFSGAALFVSFSLFDKNRIQRRGTFCLFFLFGTKNTLAEVRLLFLKSQDLFYTINQLQ